MAGAGMAEGQFIADSLRRGIQQRVNFQVIILAAPIGNGDWNDHPAIIFADKRNCKRGSVYFEKRSDIRTPPVIMP